MGVTFLYLIEAIFNEKECFCWFCVQAYRTMRRMAGMCIPNGSFGSDWSQLLNIEMYVLNEIHEFSLAKTNK